MISKFIVITTINHPSEAICKFREWSDWHVVVVGDRKTPSGWACEGVTFLGIDEQYKQFGVLAKIIPENTYTRKMLGYVYAIQNGATSIFESDDDNIPYPDAQKQVESFLAQPPRLEGERYRSESGWLNIYALFGASKCWPRGYPIEKINQLRENQQKGNDNKSCGLVQFLADEDPDVDAIYRMIDGGSAYFARDRQFILDAGTYCPVNSQATLWTSEFFPLLFLPLGVFDRVTDILRGYILTAALWKMGYSVAYASPVVYQKRNIHNLHKDFMQEVPLYENAAFWCNQFETITENNPIGFYQEAIRLLDEQKIFSKDNRAVYDLFIKVANIS